MEESERESGSEEWKVRERFFFFFIIFLIRDVKITCMRGLNKKSKILFYKITLLPLIFFFVVIED